MKLGFSYPLAHPYSVVVCQISGTKCFFGGWESHNKYWQGVSIQHCNIWQSDRWTLPFSDLNDHFLLSEWILYLNHVYHGAYMNHTFLGDAEEGLLERFLILLEISLRFHWYAHEIMFKLLCVFLAVGSTGGIIEQVLHGNESQKPPNKVWLLSWMDLVERFWWVVLEIML
jgi:hypothetical protein